MHPVILVCGSSFQDSSPLLKALETLGGEHGVAVIELSSESQVADVKALILSLEEVPSKGIRRFTSPSLNVRIEPRRISTGAIGHRRGLMVMALNIGACALRARAMQAPPPPPELKAEALHVMKAFNEEFVFEKPKVTWPKPKQIKPSASWTNRQHTFHPARSRDKARMR